MPVIGCCNSPPNLVVITQFVPIGSLYQVLHEDGGGGGGSVVVDTPRALQFASDIAKGMAFLHSLDRQMPRFHLNSKHVMVSLIHSRADYKKEMSTQDIRERGVKRKAKKCMRVFFV